MSTQIITILCEGPHDVAFIGRMLKAIGFKSNESTKIGDYPKPFDQLLVNEASKTDIEQLNLTEIRRNLLPSNTLKRENAYIFMYSLEGDAKREPRKRILKELRSFITEKGEIERLPKDTNLSLLYFFDADDKGINNRLNEINIEIKEALPELNNDPFQSNGDSIMISSLKIGAFIFSDGDTNQGKLEDILTPLMRNGNETEFDAATTYLENHHKPERLYNLKLHMNAETFEVTERRSTKSGEKEKYDFKKSLIGTIGQLQRSGKSNVVCISDSDFITLEKITKSDKCAEILTFFNNFLS